MKFDEVKFGLIALDEEYMYLEVYTKADDLVVGTICIPVVKPLRDTPFILGTNADVSAPCNGHKSVATKVDCCGECSHDSVSDSNKNVTNQYESVSDYEALVNLYHEGWITEEEFKDKRDSLPRKEIYVNTVKMTWDENYISYEELVKLVNNKDNPALFTVVYSRGYGKDGTLTPNESVKVKNGMVFDVMITTGV